MTSIWTNLPTVEGDRIRRLRREEYDRLVEAGVFADEPLELIRGVIVRRVPQGPPRAGPIQVLTKVLVRGLGDRADVRVQLPLIAPDDSEPEPDVAVVPAGDPHRRHPSEAYLVIEVARTSQAYDRGTKGPLYAEMGVPEYWLVDVEAGAVEVHREPEGGRFAKVDTVRGGTLSVAAFPAAFPDVGVDVARLLGR